MSKSDVDICSALLLGNLLCSNSGPCSRQMILKHVKALCKKNNLAVLWATHLIDEIDKGEKVIIIDKGKVLESGDVSKVIKKTKTKNIKDAFNKLVGIK